MDALRDPPAGPDAELALRVVEAVARGLARGAEPGAALEPLLDATCRLAGVTRAAVVTREPAGDGPALRVVARRGLSPAFEARMRPRHARDGTTPAALTTSRPSQTADLLADPAFDLTAATRAAVTAEGFRAVLSVPVRDGGRVLGALVAYRDAPGAFAGDAAPRLQALADGAAPALALWRAWEEAGRRRRAAESLAALGRMVSRSLDPGEVGQRIVDSVRDLLDADAATLFRVEPGGELTAVATAGEIGPVASPPVVVPAGAGIAGYAVATRRPVVTPDILADPRFALTPALRARLEQAPVRAVLALPLVHAERVAGALAVGVAPGRSFTADDLALAGAFADQAVLAMENARLYAETTRRRQEAEALARVARLLTESLDFPAVARRIVDGVLPLFGVASSGLSLLEPDGRLVTVALGGRSAGLVEPGDVMPPGLGVIGRTLAEGRPVWSRDRLADPAVTLTPAMRERLERTGNRAMLAVPLRVQGRLRGVLSIADPTPRDFGPADVALLEAFADQAAVALENSRLYGEAAAALRAAEASQQQVAQGERLRALGELAGGVAHDFNNVLAVILGRAQLLLGRTADPAVARQARIIEQMALDGARTVHRIQEFARTRRSRPPGPVDLPAVVDEVVEITRSRWHDQAHAEGIAYEVTVEREAVPSIAGDPAELREALANVLLNALDAMPRGGRLTVATRQEGAHVVCRVTDGGVGMSPETRARAFDPFFTTKGERGTGLGLSIVYGIVRRHGGEIEIDTAPGRGTTVALRFPPGQPPAAGAGRPAAPASRRARVLVIDDEAIVRDTLGELLAGLGHAVEVAPDGAEGLARALAGDFDLVLTDLGMPGLSGWEVARRVKAARPATPVGLVTGWGEELDPAEVRERGVDFLLPKPCSAEDLARVVAQAAAPRAPGPPGSPAGPDP